MIYLALIALTLLVPASASCEPIFRDVPPGHWAAEFVERAANQGLMRGYEDNTFQGDKPVTRYELAVTLERFVEFVERSRRPVIGEKNAKLTPPGHWAAKSIAFLKTNEFLPATSPLLAGGNEPVTHRELADALASVLTKLVDQSVGPDAD
jgi:hypothetical protein